MKVSGQKTSADFHTTMNTFTMSMLATVRFYINYVASYLYIHESSYNHIAINIFCLVTFMGHSIPKMSKSDFKMSSIYMWL